MRRLLDRRTVRDAAAGGALFAGLSLWYSLFPDALTAFDGLMFAGIVSERTAGWRQALFQYAGHYLYNPLGWLFHKAFTALAGPAPGYVTLSWFNHFSAAAAATLLFFLLREATGRAAAALPLALLCAHGHNYWVRASECSVYAFAMIWVVAALWSAWRYHRDPRPETAALLGVWAGLAALSHLQHVFWLPAPLLLLWRRNPRHAWLFMGVFLVLSGIPQLVTYRITSLEALKAWYLKMGSSSETTWGRTPGRIEWVFSLRHHAAGLFKALWAWPADGWSWRLVALLAAAWGSLAVLLAERRAALREDLLGAATRPYALFLALMAAGVFLFQSIRLWSDEVRYAVALSPLLSVALALALRRTQAVPWLWALWASTAAFNLAADARPRSRWDLNEDLRRSFLVARRVEPGATMLIAGGFSKLYFTGLQGLGLLTMDHYMILHAREEAMARVRAAVVADLRRGQAVYAESSLFDERLLVAAPAGKGWAPSDGAALLAPFALQEAVRLSPDRRFFRVWPRRAPPDYWRFTARRAREAGRRRLAEYAERQAGRAAPPAR